MRSYVHVIDPPSYELSGPSLSRNDRLELNNALNGAWLENLGSPIIYTWVTVIKDFLEAKEQKSEEEGGGTDEPIEPVHSISYELDIVPTIHHGEVTLVLDRLLENSKISRATHNMYAYRISELRDGREIL
ncbi:hypothetical protein ANCDUO_16216 [Ancylostoma duodenale]|uniref:RWD domain-containing protein n=1 Tax=Ancylostoma duodenale TaxID=51022 RepID=A0A0C2FYG6_9BILA|nr:hypothetical protein ANCDUO_16216 [Ancylostoma duodenale]